jgi:hypothetical protein
MGYGYQKETDIKELMITFSFNLFLLYFSEWVLGIRVGRGELHVLRYPVLFTFFFLFSFFLFCSLLLSIDQCGCRLSFIFAHLLWDLHIYCVVDVCFIIGLNVAIWAFHIL